MKLVVLIGSMQDQYRDLMERARLDFATGGARVIAPYDEVRPSDLIAPPKSRVIGFVSNKLINEELGHWHNVVEHADEVVVVPKPDGSIGAGTAAELRLAMHGRKAILWA